MLKGNQSVNTFLKALKLLTREEKNHAFLILLMVVGLGCLEAIGIFSIMPFLTVISDPDSINTNEYLNYSYNLLQEFGIRNHKQFIVFTGLISITIIIASTIYRCFSIYKMNTFIELKVHSIASRLLQNYLNHPYEYFVNKKRSEISSSILSQSNHVVDNAFRPGLNVLSNIVVLTSIVLILLLLNPIVTLLSALMIFMVYLVIFKIFKKKITSYGKHHLENTEKRFQSISNIFNGIKEIKINKRFQLFSNLFNASSMKLSVIKSRIVTLNSVPHILVESLVFSMIITVALFYILISNQVDSFSLQVFFPTLGLFAFAAVRLKPTFSSIYSGLVSLRYSEASIDHVIKELDKYVNQSNLSQNTLPSYNLDIRESITFRDLSYQHKGSDELTLEALNFSIDKGKCLGVAGSTGAGKSTLIDIISGLLKQTAGSITIDGKEIELFENSNWQALLGYVPQDIFMLDASIAENIAFGCSTNDLNFDKLRASARAVLMDDFITNHLSSGYETVIGERGSKLSGGQCQRIGIARALYNDPEILIFDESTSALDESTEKELIISIQKYFPNQTMIFVTHKKNIFKFCDKIIILEKGRILSEDTFDNLTKSSNPYIEFVSEKTG